MRMAAGLAIAALLAGCQDAGAQDISGVLRFAPDPTPDFAVLPRLVTDTLQARAINAALDRVDARDREKRDDCLSMKAENANVEWARSVEVPMAGPQFISLVVERGEYCGGAHPNWDRAPLVFDLETGRLIDWRAWLPAEMVTHIMDEGADLWAQSAYLTSPGLKTWFAGRALEGMDAYGRSNCAALYEIPVGEHWGLFLWPDAEAGGLRLQTAGLAHAEKGCQAEVVMPLNELKRRGVDAALIDALDTAHRSGLWRPAPEEGTIP